MDPAALVWVGNLLMGFIGALRRSGGSWTRYPQEHLRLGARCASGALG